MTGLTASMKRLFRANPIIVKELRSRMRGARAFITLTVSLLLMGGILFATLQIILANMRYATILSPQIGQTLFSTLAFLELFMVCAITPAVTSGAISGEKEKQTYEMLMATPLSSTRVLWGKLISAMSYVFLLLFAAVPLASVVFIFGGVAPREMLKTLVVLVVFAFSFGVIGLFMSALFGRTGRATVASFLVVAALTAGPLFLAVLVGVLQQREPPRWLLAPSPISALSSTLVSGSAGMVPGVELFYILSGIFDLGRTVNQTSIPRPMYHYTVPFHLILSVVLFMLTTRLIQPARRWSIRRKELVAGLLVLLALVIVIGAAFALTAGRYELALAGENGAGILTPLRPAAAALEAPAVRAEPAVMVDALATPTPADAAAGLEETDRAEIYAQIARRYYTTDHTFGDKPPQWLLLYLVSLTDDSTGDPNQPSGDPVALSDELQKQITENLSDLPAKIIWVKSMDEVPQDPQTGAVASGDGAVITFGNIYPQEDGSVHVSASLYFGPLGAAGKTYILVGDGGGWIISGTTGVEWIS
ncbi:MAG: ABC transporter permease [Chloroflexi bacterium]|nr:ABC transporter permease [Chloroflexota bacterium]